jgi:predicted nuclease with TOPRIM domain
MAKNKRIKKENIRLRKMNRKLKMERDLWKQRYEELNTYVERKYEDYC